MANEANHKATNDANDGEAGVAIPAVVQHVIRVIKEQFDELEVYHKHDEWVEAIVPPEQLIDFASFVRDHNELQFNFLSSVSAVDYEEDGFQVVYHLISIPEGRRKLVIKVTPEGSRDNPTVPSVVSLWPTANWHEREAWDLMGIRFTAHPDLRRILLEEDWVGHPLRKDYVDERLPRERQFKEDWIK